MTNRVEVAEDDHLPSSNNEEDQAQENHNDEPSAGEAGGRDVAVEGGFHQLFDLTGNDRMVLTEDETNLAILMKEAISDANGVDPVSDFMCAQLALIDGDDTETAVERVYHLQCFREEYRILDSVADGCRLLGAMLDLMPGLHLSFAESHSSGQSIIVYDNTKFDPKKIRSEESLRVWLGTIYYTMTSFAADFESIRQGTTLVIECEGYDWKSHADINSIKRMWTEIAGVYPVAFSRVKYFHSGTMMHVVASMLKPFLPQNLRNKLELGCQFDHRLDEVYLVPTLEEANRRMLNQVAATLQRRYENERSFRL
jgi:CRAL/TRIO domain